MSEFTRRARLYGARAWRSLPQQGLKTRCLFLHLPKCGGTSVAAGLYGTVPLQRRIGVIDALATRRAAAIQHFGTDDINLCHEDLPHGALTFALREQMLLVHLGWNTQLIHGHVLFSDPAWQAFGDVLSIVTLMRDPLDRTLSNYRMAVRAGVIADDLDAWLDSPVATSMAQVFLRYLGGKTVVLEGMGDTQMEAARRNLARIDLIGFLDDIQGFQIGFARRFGVLPMIPRYNVGTGPEITLRQKQADKLDALLVPDRMLYVEARALARNAGTADSTEGSIPVSLRQSA